MERMMRKVWSRKKGFTLIELLIVVAIIGILAGIAIPNFLGARTKARVSRAFSDMEAIATAEEMYMMDEDHYADQITTLINNDYLKNIPNCPFGDGDYSLFTSPDTSPTMFVILCDGPHSPTGGAASNASVEWDPRIRGAIGGWNGATDQAYYGISLEGTTQADGTNTDWFTPTETEGTADDGILGYGGG